MTLSIIVPTHNNFKSLSRCLKSISQQTVFNAIEFEVKVVVVDDGSEIEPKIQLIKDKELNIKYYKIPHSGAPAARNFGFSKSSGKYVFFCDADVVFLKPDALEKMVVILEKNPDKAYCYSSFKFGWKIFKSGPFDADKLKQNNYISTMSMIRREKFPGWDESLKKFQDWDLWLAMLEKGETGIWLPEVLWQVSTDGTISRWLPKIIYKLPFLKRVREFEKAKEVIKKKHGL